MANIHQSSIKQANEIINTINQINSNKTSANQFQITSNQIQSPSNPMQTSSNYIQTPSNQFHTPKSSQISDYYNMQYNSFSSPSHSQHSQIHSQKPTNNPSDKLSDYQFDHHSDCLLDSKGTPYRIRVPTESSHHMPSPRLQKIYHPNRQNLKESHVEQSLQKVFSLNRNTQRIPFKKHKSNFIDFKNLEGEKHSYSFFEPNYSDYSLKQHKHFWTESFQRFNQKRSSSHTLDFPSFNQKDHSKITERFSDIKKVSEIQKLVKSRAIQKYANKTIILSSIVAVAILVIGLKFLSSK